MRKHYTYIIWGIIFVYFNIRLGFFDILPDFIGYALIASGLNGLGSTNPEFKKGTLPAVVLFFGSIIFMFYPIDIARDEISPANIWYIGVSALNIIFALIIYYYMCKGIYTLAINSQNTELQSSAKTRWNLIFYSTLIYLTVIPFIINTKSTFITVYAALSILMVLLAISIIFLLRRARKELCISEISES